MVISDRKNNFEKRSFINEEIRAYKILLLDEEWEKIWLFSRMDALKKWEDEWKDIIQLWYNPTENIATAKMMDYWRFMYLQKKDTNQKKKTQKLKWVKEVKFGYSIWENDLNLKMKKAKEFLEEWYSVKFVAVLRWRENQYKSKVYERMNKIIEQMQDSWKSQWIKDEKNGCSVVLLGKSK